MKLIKKILLTSFFVLMTVSSVLAKSDVRPDSIPDLSMFRLSYDQMTQIANHKRLSHRIFYEKVSQGPDAVWFNAVKRGDIRTVIGMVQNGQNIEVKDTAALGQTALGWVAFIGYEDIFDYLILQGADIHATDKADVYNVLKSAVLGGNINIIKKSYELLKDEFDINMIESDGESILMVAALNGHLEAVEFFLTFNPDLNIVSKQFDVSALSGACERGFKDVVELLIQKGAINHKTGKSDCSELGFSETSK